MKIMNRKVINTDFAAKEPALGYYYQIQYNLYLFLKSLTEFEPEIT